MAKLQNPDVHQDLRNAKPIKALRCRRARGSSDPAGATKLHKRGTSAEAPGVTRTALDARDQRRHGVDAANTGDVPGIWPWFDDSKGETGMPGRRPRSGRAGLPLSLFIQIITDNDNNPLDGLPPGRRMPS